MDRHASPASVADLDGGVVGREVELDHPDDPVGVLAGRDGTASAYPFGDAARPPPQSPDMRRLVSFQSSPLNRSPGGNASAGGKVPIVKIVNTSHPDINGKLGYVHAYYRPRERYAVTLLGREGNHPALVYFGVLDAEGIRGMHTIREEETGNGRAPREHTLFLPPTAVAPLQFLDVASLHLQYFALHILGMPRLAWGIEHMMGTLQNRVLPPLRLENFWMFFVFILLPVGLSRVYDAILARWETLDMTFGAGGGESLPVLPNLIAMLSGHLGEAFTISLLLVGTSTIARFLFAEYRLVNQKAKAMLSQQAGGVRQRKNFSLEEMFSYRIDYHFSTSKWAKVALLLSFTYVLIAVGAGLLVVLTEDHSISNAVWLAWTYVADPGTHADCPEAFLIRLVSFGVTLGGMLIFALMIGIISDYIAEKVDGLKKGKSRIIDIDHTVMLGWNDKSLAVIQQVALANESEGGGTIVVLASKEKEKLEEILASAVASKENPLRLLGTEVMFRSGNPLLESELRRVSTQTARCVISLSSEELDPDEADATQVRQVMALKAFEDFQGSRCHVVVEVADIDNKDLFPLVAPDFAEVVVTHDIIGRLMLQCARCPGLASTFYDITTRFDDAVPIGIKYASDGRICINPENDLMIREGDKILVLAEDNDSYEVNDGTFKTGGVGNVPTLTAGTKAVERILFCGWRRDMADMIMQLDQYVERGSELWLFNLVPAKERADLLKDKGNKEDLKLENLTICNAVGNSLVRRDLNNIKAVDTNGKPTGQTITLDQFDSILILADAVAIENGANMMSCDSRSLSSLLIIQDIQKKLYEERNRSQPDAKVPCSPISEILDSRTKSLLSVANCKGYIMSNQIISSVIAQVSEEKDINNVLHEILTAEGSETYIRPVSRFIDLEKEDEMSFWEIALRARQLQEVAIGYKPAGMDYVEAEELIINPPDKSAKRKWATGDDHTLVDRRTSRADMVDAFASYTYKSCSALAAASRAEWTANYLVDGGSGGNGAPAGRTKLATSGILTGDTSSRLSKAGRAFAILSLGDLPSSMQSRGSAFSKTSTVHASIKVFLFGDALGVLRNQKKYMSTGNSSDKSFDRNAIFNAKSRFASVVDAQEYARARSVVQELEAREDSKQQGKNTDRNKSKAAPAIVTTGWACRTCKNKTLYKPTSCIHARHDVRQVRELKGGPKGTGTRKERLDRHGKDADEGGLTLGSGLEWSGWRGGFDR
ncbi:hypothetical protein ACHAXT_011047 [Thalassiosira profunda]